MQVYIKILTAEVLSWITESLGTVTSSLTMFRPIHRILPRSGAKIISVDLGTNTCCLPQVSQV